MQLTTILLATFAAMVSSLPTTSTEGDFFCGWITNYAGKHTSLIGKGTLTAPSAGFILYGCKCDFWKEAEHGDRAPDATIVGPKAEGYDGILAFDCTPLAA